MAVQIPNLKIKSILEGLINLVKSNYASKLSGGVVEESWLYRAFYGVTYGEWDFYEQVKELLINRGENHPKKLDIRIGFPNQKPKVPTINIISPMEDQRGINSVGMGMDSNLYYSNDGDDIAINSIFNRGFQGSYELMINSSNEFETELIYRLIQALFIANYDTINEHFNGTFSFSGKDTFTYQDTLPFLFIKSFKIDLQYTQSVPSMITEEYLNDVLFVINNITT
jgi:hypothetical protein